MTAHEQVPVAPLLSSAQLDAIACALDSSMLMPYTAPARPFTVGTRATFGVRAEYTSQTPTPATTLELNASIVRDANRVANSIGEALGHTAVEHLTVSVRANGEYDVLPLSAAQPHDAVIVCADTLQRLDNPTALLEALASALERAAVAVVAVPLRPLGANTDDLGPPRNPAFARQWNFPELQAGLDAFGLEPLFGGLAPSDAATDATIDTTAAPAAIGIMIVARRTARARFAIPRPTDS